MATLPLSAVAFALCFGFLVSTGAAEDAADDAELQRELEALRVKHGVPALGAGMMREGKLVTLAVTGFRKQGSDVPVTRDDFWHLGSCTKAMTATLAATLVQEGKLRWESTVGEAFPQWRRELAPGWAGVTLQQLLTHTAGAPEDAPPDLWSAAWKAQGTATEQRKEFVHGLLTRPPQHPPGTQYGYSNQGYAIAGYLLEQLAGQPWEALLRQRIFAPLQMHRVGFGAPGTPGKLDAPWGHAARGGLLKPIPPGPQGDNPAAIGPAGTAYASLEDWLRFCSLHATGEREGGIGLTPATFQHLHTPSGVGEKDYAPGWIVTRRPWAGGRVFTHAGSNTMWMAITWVLPEKGVALCTVTNAGNGDAVCDAAIGLLIKRMKE